MRAILALSLLLLSFASPAAEKREIVLAGTGNPVYVAFTRARDMSAVGRDLSAALKAMKRDGTHAGIFARYFK